MADLVAQRRAILRKYHGGGAGARVVTRTIAGRKVAVSLETGTVVGTPGLTPSQYESQQKKFIETGKIVPPTAERARGEVQRLDTKIEEEARAAIKRQKVVGFDPKKVPLITLAKRITPKKEVSKITLRKRLFDISLIEQARQEQELARQFFPADVPKKTIKLAATIAVTGVVGGVARGIIGAGLALNQLRKNPIKVIKETARALSPTQLPRTLRAAGQSFLLDPGAFLVDFYAFNAALGLTGKIIKRSPVGKFVGKELYIARLPKELKTPARKILRASKVQRRIYPTPIKDLKRVDFMRIRSLTPIEARILQRIVRQTDSVVFGSAAAKAAAGKFRTRLPVPKDVDIAAKSAREFSQRFINNLPKNTKRNYVIRGEKVIRKSTGQPLFDIKPLSRLVQQRSILTGKGLLPVSGFVRRVKGIEQFRIIRTLAKEINKLKERIRLNPKKTVREKQIFRSDMKKLGKLQNKLRSEKRGIKISELPKIIRKPVVGALTVPTEKIIKIKGIRVTGFGEQTIRKGLGTLQVLIERNIRRAKDPQAFLISLEVQIEALKMARPRTAIGRLRNKRRIRILSDTTSLLKSKAFTKLLEKKVPGITKNFPLVARIDTKKLKRIKLEDVRESVRKRIARLRKPPRMPPERPPVEVPRLRPSEVPISSVLKRPTKIPSIIPTMFAVTRIPPTRIPRRPPTRLPPTKIPVSKLFKVPSKLPIVPSVIPISRIPRRPPTRLPPTKIPRVPISKLPPKVRKKIIEERKLKKLKEKKRRELSKLAEKIIPQQKFIYIPDLYSRVYKIKAKPKERAAFLRAGRVFTGIESRPLIPARIIKRLRRKR